MLTVYINRPDQIDSQCKSLADLIRQAMIKGTDGKMRGFEIVASPMVTFRDRHDVTVGGDES